MLAKVLFLHAIFVVGFPAFAETKEASWHISLRTEVVRAWELGFGRGYDISSSRLHVPVTKVMADVFAAAPRAELVSFLALLVADEAYRKQRNYLSKCVSALAEDERSAPFMMKFSDGHEEPIIYYHIAFPALPKKNSKEPIQRATDNDGAAPRRV
jgi:hypothetical protein